MVRQRNKRVDVEPELPDCNLSQAPVNEDGDSDFSEHKALGAGKREMKLQQQLRAIRARQKKEVSQCRDKQQKRELQQRHAAEVAQLLADKEPSEDRRGLDGAGVPVDDSTVMETAYHAPSTPYGPEKPLGKHSKRRLLREQRRELMQLKRTDGSTRGSEEYAALEQSLKTRGLSIFDIAPDGHCMFRAIEHQLSLDSTRPLDEVTEQHEVERPLATSDNSDDENTDPDRENTEPQEWRNAGAGSLERRDVISFSTLRAWAASYMLEHRDVYEAFFEAGYVDEDSAFRGQGRTFEEHCSDIGDTVAWGGELELSALSSKLGRPIEVYLSGVSTPRVYSPCDSGAFDSPLRLSFHRFMYSTGCHYNSVVPFAAT